MNNTDGMGVSGNEINSIAKRVRKMTYRNKEILIIDYSNGNEAEMIAAATEVKELILTENKLVLTLSIFNERSYATPKFMRHVETVIMEFGNLTSKNAAIGLSKPKIMILDGLNLLLKKSIISFGSIDEALDFLVSDNV